MKALLLSFGLGLVVALQAQAFPAMEESQDVSGTWYVKATVSDKEIPGKKLGSLSVTSMTIKTLEEGNLEIKFTVWIAGQCREMSIVLERTDEPGKYTAFGGTHVLYIIPSGVEGHYFFYWESKKHGFRSRMANLVGRDPDINQEALEDFQNAVRAGGLNPENIFISKQNGLAFEINNKVTDPFFVTTKYNLSVKELAERNTLLAYTLLIYNKLLRHECMGVLGDCLLPAISKIFNQVRNCVPGDHNGFPKLHMFGCGSWHLFPSVPGQATLVIMNVSRQTRGQSLKMKILLLTVTLFVLVTVLQAQDDLPFLSEDKNVSGIWYRKAIVDDINITEWKRSREEFPFVVRDLGEGNMEITSVYMYNDQCLWIDFLMEKTEKPGQYSTLWGTYLVYIYELPVTDHYIFYSEYQYFEQKVYAGELIGKDPEENHEALEEFKKFAQRKDLPPENIIVPEQRAASQNCKP
ncbi:hypothetical protein STEG23_015035 [Scotinomys teguina]